MKAIPDTCAPRFPDSDRNPIMMAVRVPRKGQQDPALVQAVTEVLIGTRAGARRRVIIVDMTIKKITGGDIRSGKMDGSRRRSGSRFLARARSPREPHTHSQAGTRF